MTVHSFIADKRDGHAHSPEDLAWFVRSLTAGEIPDYQISAWLMAAYLKGLDEDETAALTMAMAHSGDTLRIEGLDHPVIDKHSTGGVGDAVTLLFLPIMAACGVPVVKMSGRGLGFTGGTIDKLESIPGFRTDLSPRELAAQARSVGCALGGQTANLAPADKVLYGLRDATETIGSISLIAASVMSKKLAGGADAIVLDVKVGSGAFMKSREEARALAQALLSIGERAGKKMSAFITDMNQPLAPAVGNALEVRAAIEELKSGCKGRLGEVTLTLCSAALELAGQSADPRQVVALGQGLAKMREWIAAQGGNASVVDDPSLLPRAPIVRNIASSSDGFFVSCDASALGEIARELGAGRLKKDDTIDPSVGFEIRRALGEKITAGEPLFVVHARTAADAKRAEERLLSAVTIGVGTPVAGVLTEPVS